MFEQINRHRYLSVLEVGENHEEEFRILIAEAQSSEKSNLISADQEPDEAIRELLNSSRSIEVTESSCIYEIRFESYIIYSVIDESFTSADPTDIYEGNLARVYLKSAFLEYVSKSTFATEEYPGPFKHYGFCCLDHIIDVASEEPPKVKRLNA